MKFFPIKTMLAKERTEQERMSTSHPYRVYVEGGFCVSLDGHRGRHAEKVLGPPRTCTAAQEMVLRSVIPFNAQIRSKEWLPQNGRRRRSAPAVICKRSGALLFSVR